ncbi:MAG: hypothetical protein IAF02_08840 [Anaerolineae bacterium]|nr:hypothetical protein [Anaerolineae bacterium]
MKKVIPIIVIIIALFAASIAAAQTPANVVITPSTDSVTVGDPIELTVTVTHPADTQVLMPALEPNWGDFIVRSQSAVDTVDNGDGTATSTQTIDVRLFAPGAFETPPLNVTIADNNGQIVEATAPSVPFTVNSVLVEGDTELRDIKPQAALPNPYLWPVFIAALGALIATAVWFIARRIKEAFDNRLPHEVALDTLAAVEKEQLPENGRFKEHYTLVTDALRAYVEQTQGIQATDRTTAEIQKELSKSSLTTEQAKQFTTILSESDLVKFAKFTPDIDSAYALVAESRQFIEATKPEPVVEDKKNKKSGNGSQTTNYALRTTETSS